ncbi:DNA repair helicase XPB [Entomospira culicis]|uniref:DNA 3'-5' helicase n=1 Tax=Entomospira culicis TaxID=2719989 RepID=A0A968KVL3_9SPIO|nr:DNA repair helicase XPB [Entomospira culicis]NIZ19033.1 DEAD/DEAH box helicase family protein [Entomospira culicis]NIZ69248.1 DEAD/DEAH box helicase family protein [Entomospira culicis]WDI37832.1 helicase-associated domain-containing protein [Entomospira culicis]WDI39460.1 helicase-associated domain-containing protein [Entomospira culicis]
MKNNESKPLIVQSDGTLILDTHEPLFEEARSAISLFADLEKSPEHFHQYRINDLSLWNACAMDITLAHIETTLKQYSRYPIPPSLMAKVEQRYDRYGHLKLESHPTDETQLIMKVLNKPHLMRELQSQPKLRKLIITEETDTFRLNALDRGLLKHELIKLGWPVTDLAPLTQGDPLAIDLLPSTQLRPYQQSAVTAFLGDKQLGRGFGTVILPCGAGKTLVGIGTMQALQCETLILAANIAAARQWIREIVTRTTLTEDQVSEYSGQSKVIAPVTVATYQILVWRKAKTEPFLHFNLFKERKWGLIIYDEAHLLPAPVFRITSEIQSVRRLGLTATLVREDNAEAEVFTLIGPKRFDAPWKELEHQGWIATAQCVEVKCDLNEKEHLEYAIAPNRSKIRIASEAVSKITLVKAILALHQGKPTIIIGQYLSQLQAIAKELNLPIITGKTPQDLRDDLYNQFRNKTIQTLILSKVANFSIDLPDATIAIQLSGSFGSRQEEAQRLGRILRPKEEMSYFYSLVSRFTLEEEFAINRMRFLTEQGYTYQILSQEDFFDD